MTVLPKPRYDTSIRTADGRTIAVARWGPSGGVPVIARHGTPMRRLRIPGS